MLSQIFVISEIMITGAFIDVQQIEYQQIKTTYRRSREHWKRKTWRCLPSNFCLLRMKPTHMYICTGRILYISGKYSTHCGRAIPKTPIVIPENISSITKIFHQTQLFKGSIPSSGISLETRLLPHGPLGSIRHKDYSPLRLL